MRLRRLELKDAPGMLEWMHDTTINKNFRADFSAYNLEKVEAFISHSLTDQDKHFACTDEFDEYLGTVSLKNIDWNSRNAEYAISFRKKTHGTGASYFATDEILKIAFYKLNLEKVYLNVSGKNLRAISFYEKYGFTLEGHFKKHILINGVLEDLLWFGILKDDYIRRLKDEENTIRNF